MFPYLSSLFVIAEPAHWNLMILKSSVSISTFNGGNDIQILVPHTDYGELTYTLNTLKRKMKNDCSSRTTSRSVII